MSALKQAFENAGYVDIDERLAQIAVDAWAKRLRENQRLPLAVLREEPARYSLPDPQRTSPVLFLQGESSYLSAASVLVCHADDDVSIHNGKGMSTENHGR
jgi:hypothetical protein